MAPKLPKAYAEAVDGAPADKEHWSTVTKGSHFDLIVHYDPEVYEDAQRRIPMQRLKSGYVECMANSSFQSKEGSDSAHHCALALRSHFNPHLLSEVRRTPAPKAQAGQSWLQATTWFCGGIRFPAGG